MKRVVTFQDGPMWYAHFEGEQTPVGCGDTEFEAEMMLRIEAKLKDNETD